MNTSVIRATIPYSVIPLNPDGTRHEGRPPVVGTALVDMSSQYEAPRPDDDPARPTPVRFNLTVDGQNAIDWDMDDFRFQCWPTVGGITCDDDGDDPPKYGFLEAMHVTRATEEDGTPYLTLKPVKHALFVMGLTGETPPARA